MMRSLDAEEANVSRWSRLVRAVGWDDGKGSASFNKQATMIALMVWAGLTGAVAWIAVATGTFPPAMLVAALSAMGGFFVGAGFGLKGLSMVSKQRTEALQFVEQSATTTTLDGAAMIRAATDAVKARRDVERGIDPA